MKPCDLIAAIDLNRGIGKNGGIPWNIPEDTKYFHETTSRVVAPGATNAVIMGRKTWESIPPSKRPLDNRLNIVITRSKDIKLPPAVLQFPTLPEALEALEQISTERIYIIGGERLYSEALDLPQCDKVYLTLVQGKFDCDAFFPPYTSKVTPVSESPSKSVGDLAYRFLTFRRVHTTKA